MATLEDLKRQGKIRSIGASNLTVEELNSHVAAGPLDAIQEEYSMIRRGIEATLLPACAAHGVSTLSYSSLALGLLSGGIGPDRVFEGDDQRKDNPRFSIANREKVARLTREIGPIAEAHGASPGQIVIAWTMQQPGITFSLCGARNPDQARENARAGRIRLSPADIQTIGEAATRHLTDLDADRPPETTKDQRRTRDGERHAMPEQRDVNLDLIRRDGAFDVIVVGGGINGIGVYRELALQGLRVLLIERNDFCSGCSAAPSRMIHGGLRYLENGEFDLVWELLRERDALLLNAPHMVRALPTTIPINSVFSGPLNGAAGFLA